MYSFTTFLYTFFFPIGEHFHHSLSLTVVSLSLSLSLNRVYHVWVRRVLREARLVSVYLLSLFYSLFAFPVGFIQGVVVFG